VLAICGGALATLDPDQLRAFGRPAAGPEVARSDAPEEDLLEDERVRKASSSADAGRPANRAR